MNQVSLLPESAPFSDEQRAWLDGFLAGWLGIQENGQNSPNGFGGPALIEEPPEEEEDFPWHDPAIPLDERLEMAVERPYQRKLMAAMAQLDCGSCGYDCQRYAEAIASGEESSLKLCSPGGTETAKKLKELVKLGGETSPSTNGTPLTQPTTAESGWTRKNPFPAKIIHIRNLNREGSAKQTSHVEIDLSGSGISYEVGDSLGVYPTNCDDLVSEVVSELQATGTEEIEVNGRNVLLSEALKCECCLAEISEELLEVMAKSCADTSDQKRLKDYIEDAEPITSWDVLELLRSFPGIRLSPQKLISALSPMKPRLYSISSSMKAHPDQVHLTIGRVSWEFGNRQRKGVASTMFADRMDVGTEVRVFIQKSHGFTVPADPNAKVIMIGPGTGIAPFRAFLQERMALQAGGENWLFFGDQRQSTDFLYCDELLEMQNRGHLTKIDLAFSRDQQEKIYVQDRMREQGQELWNWIQQGAHLYVCGDAKRMAGDVDRVLKEVIAQHGQLDESAATELVADLSKQKRYCRDVY